MKYYAILFLALVLSACMQNNNKSTLKQHPLFVGKTNAPALPADARWVNTTQAYTLNDFKGRPVLLDFWTFGCINCIHIQPMLHRLQQRHPNLVIVGIHSAKFSGEQDDEKILKATQRFGITHPVINDYTMALWKAYAVRAWPTLVLITPDGKQVAKVEGEGHYKELDSLLTLINTEYKDTEGFTTKAFEFSYSKTNLAASGLNFPAKLFADTVNDLLYISDSNNNRILCTDADGNTQFTIGAGSLGFADGTFATAQFTRPMGLALQGNLLYIADRENHVIRVANLTTKTVTTLLGIGKQASRRQKEIKQPGALSSPWDVAILPNNNLAIAMAGYHQLWQYNPSTKVATPLAGTGREDIFDAPAAEAQLAQPTAMVSVGNALYFIDAETSAIRVLENNKVTTLVGKGLFDFGDVDGPFAKAQVQHPQGLCYNKGKLYIADTYNDKIKVFDLKTKTVSTLPSLEKAKLDGPADVKVLNNTLYIANTNNSTIWAYNLATGQVAEFMIKPKNSI